MLDQRRLAMKENNDVDLGLARLRSAYPDDGGMAVARRCSTDLRLVRIRSMTAASAAKTTAILCGDSEGTNLFALVAPTAVGATAVVGAVVVVARIYSPWLWRRRRVNSVGLRTVERDAAGNAAGDRESSAGDDSSGAAMLGALVAIKQQAFTGFRSANTEGVWRHVSESSVREVAELYGSEKSFVVEVQRALSGLRYTAFIALERSRQASTNGNTEVEGPGIGPSKHGGGSVSFVTTNERLTNTSETPPTVNELYLHLHTVNHDGVTFTDTRSERFYDKLRRRRLELTQATPDQPVDDEAVYLNVAGECPKGRVYGLGSLRRKKRRYADPGASTSQMLEMVPHAEFDIVAEQLRKVMAFMHKQFGMTMDRAGLSQPQPPPSPPPPHD
ncbi:hypothetical protein Syun_007538 [Stephania yunnanensis]|uniref:Uncharacterized protein n=1 Tax=Stephania yunnanensis TaxID=152371 RepID=A0AAP0PYL6_9MAGN